MSETFPFGHWKRRVEENKIYICESLSGVDGPDALPLSYRRLIRDKQSTLPIGS